MIKDRLIDAFEFAAEKHAGQEYRPGMPYVFHPVRVMLRVSAAGGDTGMKIAALLHDVVEDTDVEIEAVKARFGFDAGDLVNRLTRRDGEIYRAYIERLARDQRAVVVKVADVLDNLGNLSQAPSEMHSLGKRYRWALEVLIPMLKPKWWNLNSEAVKLLKEVNEWEWVIYDLNGVIDSGSEEEMLAQFHLYRTGEDEVKDQNGDLVLAQVHGKI